MFISCDSLSTWEINLFRWVFWLKMVTPKMTWGSQLTTTCLVRYILTFLFAKLFSIHKSTWLTSVLYNEIDGVRSFLFNKISQHQSLIVSAVVLVAYMSSFFFGGMKCSSTLWNHWCILVRLASCHWMSSWTACSCHEPWSGYIDCHSKDHGGMAKIARCWAFSWRWASVKSIGLNEWNNSNKILMLTTYCCWRK